jgi:hypothetical protein
MKPRKVVVHHLIFLILGLGLLALSSGCDEAAEGPLTDSHDHLAGEPSEEGQTVHALNTGGLFNGEGMAVALKEIKLPQNAEDMAIDFTGDGKGDNALGNAFRRISELLDLTGIDPGKIFAEHFRLKPVLVKVAIANENVTFEINLGQSETGAVAKLDGSEAFKIKEKLGLTFSLKDFGLKFSDLKFGFDANNNISIGPLAPIRFSLTPASMAKFIKLIPDEIKLMLKRADASESALKALAAMKLDIVIKQFQCKIITKDNDLALTFHAYLPWRTIQEKVLPEIAKVIEQFRGGLYLVRQLFDTNYDNHISVEEVLRHEFFQWLLQPDVRIEGEQGFSLGMGVVVVSTTIK